MTIAELWESLKGNSRVISGELTIPGFSDVDYDDLFETLLEELAPHIGTNYEFFYAKWARAYHRQKQLQRHTWDFPDPQYEKPLEQQTIREQLATLKFFIKRRFHSAYGAK